MALLDVFFSWCPSSLLAFVSRVRSRWPDLYIGLLAPLRILKLDSRRFGPPKGMVDCSSLLRDTGAKLVEFPRETWRLCRPLNYTRSLVSVFPMQVMECHFSPNVIELTKGRVLGPDGAVISPDDRVVSEYSQVIGRPGKAHPLLGRLKLPRLHFFNGRLAVLQVHQANNYYHWLMEVLPRLELIRRSGVVVDAYYVSDSSRFQSESLKLLGIESDKICRPEDFPHVEASCLLVPARPLIGRPSPAGIDFLRREISGSVSPQKGIRIYITRRGAARRRVLNEEELLSILHDYEFTIVEAEKLSFAEQVKTFAHAEWVVAPHGAGLANLAFCAPGTRVLELFAADYVNDCYWALAGAGRLDYCCLVYADEGKNVLFKQGPHGRSDIRVDVNRVRCLLEAWIS